MDIEEKIARAKPNSWVVDNMSKTDIKSTVALARISATIERKRLDKTASWHYQIFQTT